MTSDAYHLNDRFIDELLIRINDLIGSSVPSETFGDLFKINSRLPTKEQLASIIDTVFWTSFSKDEGNAVTASIILTEADDSFDTFRFDEPLQFNIKNLVKLAVALENPRAEIGVIPDEAGKLFIWGFKSRPDNSIIADLWVQILGPGHTLITYGGKNLAALMKSKAVFIDQTKLMESVIPKLSSPGDEPEALQLSLIRYNSLLATAREMREHGRGGTLLIVPDSEDWKQFIRTPVPYTGGANFLESDYDVSKKTSLLPPITDLFSSFFKNKEAHQREKLYRMRKQVEQQCRHIARLTAVDGALVMTFDRYVFCFGAKISFSAAQEGLDSIEVISPIEGNISSTIRLSDLGGTRHQSAAQYAFAYPESVAVVVSQDGDVTFFSVDSTSQQLVAVQQSELAALHEGLGAIIWNYATFSKMKLLFSEEE
jgi:hypothetical protein